MLRELLADLKRQDFDKKVNNRVYTVLTRNSKEIEEQSVKSEDLKIGDIIELKDNQIMPADCLLVSIEAPFSV